MKQLIRYAGDGGGLYQVFGRERRLAELPPAVVPLPGAQPTDLCLVLDDDLWETLKFYSLFIDALCIQEWSVFTDDADQDGRTMTRGEVYQLLTDRPDTRRPLTWERNRIEVLMLEGQDIHCFWTQQRLTPQTYDLDHLIPVATSPINELWNLVPADRTFNQRAKRARMPSSAWQPVRPERLRTTYGLYDHTSDLRRALARDADCGSARRRRPPCLNSRTP